MDPRNIWDIENIFDLVENNNNDFHNNIKYYEYENDINEFKYDSFDNDFYI